MEMKRNMIKIRINKEPKKEADEIAIVAQDKIMERMLREMEYEDKIEGVGIISKNSDKDDVLQYRDRAKVFGLHFLDIIRLFESRCKMLELMETVKDETKEDKEKRADYSLKKVVLLFSNKKGNIRRTIIVEQEEKNNEHL